MSDIAYREQSFSPGRMVSLFELDLSPLGVAQTLYFTVGANGTQPIQFRGNTYTPVDIEASGFEISGKGPIAQPTVRIANVTNAITSLLEDYDDLVGARVRRIRTFTDFLDGGLEGRNASWTDPMAYANATAFNAEWETPSGSGELTFSASGDSDGSGYVAVGNNSGNDMRWLIHRQSVRFNPGDLYEISARVYREAGAGTVYLGVAGRDINDTKWISTLGTDVFSSAHYVAASGAAPTNGVWTTYTGYFKGLAATAGGVAPNQASPSALRNGIRYFRPLVLVNYNGVAGITRIGEVKWRKIAPASVAYEDYAFPTEVYTVERKSAHNRTFVEWQLNAALDQEGKMLPGRQVLRDTCMQRYRTWNGTSFDYSKATCPYTGTGYFKADGTATTAALDSCGKKLSDCRLRFGQNGQLPTRKFPGVSRLRVQ